VGSLRLAKGAGGLCTPPDSGEIPFQDKGRAFYVFYGFGPNASHATHAKLPRCSTTFG